LPLKWQIKGILAKCNVPRIKDKVVFFQDLIERFLFGGKNGGNLKAPKFASELWLWPGLPGLMP